MTQRPADVDARFLLANERTLLAWIRTGLTLLAGAAGLAQFGSGVRARTPLAVLLALVGVGSVVVGGIRYYQADQAMRRGELPGSVAAPLAVAGTVAVLGVALLVAVLA